MLLTLMAVLMGGNSYAGDVFSVILDGGATQSTAGYFTITDGGGYNTKYTGTYKGYTYSKGLKLNSSSKIEFTTTSESKVIIVQSLTANDTKTFKFDDIEIENSKGVDYSSDKVREYTFENVAVGSHSFTYKGETGILFVSVEYTGASLEVLPTPVITVDENTGEVTITGDANASSIVYTKDGSSPSYDNGETYTAPFTVEDGTVVKAIAIGDGETYANSQVASVTVYLANVQVSAPVISVVYGTFAITCETSNVTLEYSTDGTNYRPYTIPVTLFEDATVYARATRGNTVAEATPVEVDAVSAGDATQTITLTYDAFEAPAVIDGLSTLVGKDAAEGYSLVLNVTKKNWSSGASLNGKESIKLSSGAENILRLPSGYAATRITFYSYVNSSNISTNVNGWKSVTGVEDTEYSTIPMGATSGSPATVFDVRVFPLTGTETEIAFNNAGTQLCFYIVLDVKPTKSVLTAAYNPATLTVIDGEEFDAPVLSVTNEDGDEVTDLTINYESSNEKVATVDNEGNIAIVGGGVTTITANILGGDDYADATATLELTVISYLDVTGNPTEVVLTKDIIEANGYLSVTTDNWNTGKTYGDYKGDFYNMSRSERQLSITVAGALAFEVLVQNATEGRTYTVTIDDGEAMTIEHGGTGVESSGLFECEDGVMTITLAGSGSSVYPVAFKFYSILPFEIDIKSVGYATFYDSSNAYTIPEGVTAYVVENVTNKRVVLSELSDVIPADCGVILEGPAGFYKLYGSTESPEIPVNMLRGTDEEEWTTGELEGGVYKFYALTVSNDVLGFYYMAENGAAFINREHKAYLVIPDEGTGTDTNFLSLFENDGISQVMASTEDAEKPAYNLAGQRVGDNYRGVVIVNGMKHIRK